MGTEFDDLRERIHDLTEGFGVATGESVTLAREMAQISGHVDEDLRTGVGFARGFGGDPAQSARFFAEIRHFGGARNETDNRRLALLIAEAVNQGGTRHRMAEVLGEISSFATLAARQALAAPNVEGYTSALSTLTGMNFPGLKGDPGAAGQLLDRSANPGFLSRLLGGILATAE